ncbi:MAG TPA: FHA domain-containing protein [Macromonas sp.]|nr:FHA domain-containing protein [Macromonas sp.]
MVTMTISMDDVDLKVIELTKERTTLGRRPYNDIVIDNLAVSGEHAVFLLRHGSVEVEDLASTNGTYVNGKAIHTAPVGGSDLIEVARYKIRLQTGADPAGSVPAAQPAQEATAPAAPGDQQRTAARICVINGAAAGREMPLLKVVTTLGKPGVAVASITQRPTGYTLALVDGQGCMLNDLPVDKEPVALRHNDVIELAGTRMRFEQDA